ncbi:hypothetical protein [Paraburkholderia graminis]|uniref:hypothetical protein n=1 Tax=Paraburkholderia graminis TaxID=60548 RepID=UPI0038BAE805
MYIPKKQPGNRAAPRVVDAASAGPYLVPVYRNPKTAALRAKLDAVDPATRGTVTTSGAKPAARTGVPYLVSVDEVLESPFNKRLDAIAATLRGVSAAQPSRSAVSEPTAPGRKAIAPGLSTPSGNRRGSAASQFPSPPTDALKRRAR